MGGILRTNALQSIYSGIFDIVQINKRVNYFVNYKDVNITTEAYRNESLDYFKNAYSELDYYNNLVYKSINKLDSRDKILNISKLENVTLYFINGTEKNYTLPQGIEMVKSIALSILDRPIANYSEKMPEIEWLLNNTNQKLRAQNTIKNNLIQPQLSIYKDLILDFALYLKKISIIGIILIFVSKLTFYYLVYSTKEKLCLEYYNFSDLYMKNITNNCDFLLSKL